MPAQGYTIGKDVAVDIIGPNGPKRFAVRTGFDSKQETNSIRVKRADGLTDFLELPDGWSGSFDFERSGGEIDAYFAELEELYYHGEDWGSVTITETITERGGQVSQYRYTGVALKYSSAGTKAGGDTVKQKVDFMAQRRVKVV